METTARDRDKRLNIPRLGNDALEFMNQITRVQHRHELEMHYECGAVEVAESANERKTEDEMVTNLNLVHYFCQTLLST